MIKRRKLANYYLVILIIFFLLNLLVLNMNSKVELALIFIALLIISKKIFKYRRCNIFNKNTILGTMALIGVIQVSIHYVIGLLTDFSKNALPISEHIILVIVIQLTIIIIIYYSKIYYMMKQKKLQKMH